MDPSEALNLQEIIRNIHDSQKLMRKELNDLKGEDISVFIAALSRGWWCCGDVHSDRSICVGLFWLGKQSHVRCPSGGHFFEFPIGNRSRPSVVSGWLV
jgi:hypothetical protein